MATRSRPVAARASFTAAVTAVLPSLVNFTMSAKGTAASSASAHSTSIACGREKLVPMPSDRRTASTTGGKACPSATARSPMPYSTNSLPSSSHTRQPSPRATKPGERSGNWSSPLA